MNMYRVSKIMYILAYSAYSAFFHKRGFIQKCNLFVIIFLIYLIIVQILLIK